MTKRLKSKHKVDRRLKVNLWGRPKSPFNTRAYPPGQHGQSRSSKPSDYGIQLQAKQKLKCYYGNMNERQFRNMYKKALMKKGDSAENLIGLLERRLDAVIYRAKLSNTIFSSRQLINHGHVRVNGKKVNVSSYQVKEEDSIEIRDKSKKLAIIAKKYANKVYITDDNPRYENPKTIRESIIKYCPKGVEIADRRKAIHEAILKLDINLYCSAY